MKELIEKIVERLQDLRDSNSNSAKGSWNRNDSLIFSNISHAFQQAIDIIHEEAKSYNESVKTNADYIRSLSDEELADMLHNIGSYVNDGEPLIDIWIGEKETTLDDSFGDILDWLKAEREG